MADHLVEEEAEHAWLLRKSRKKAQELQLFYIDGLS